MWLIIKETEYKVNELFGSNDKTETKTVVIKLGAVK